MLVLLFTQLPRMFSSTFIAAAHFPYRAHVPCLPMAARFRVQAQAQAQAAQQIEHTHLHLFPATLSVAVESVATNGTHDKQVGCRAEAASRQVAAVLHGLVAAGGGHILRHDGRLEEFVTKPERGE